MSNKETGELWPASHDHKETGRGSTVNNHSVCVRVLLSFTLLLPVSPPHVEPAAGTVNVTLAAVSTNCISYTNRSGPNHRMCWAADRSSCSTAVYGGDCVLGHHPTSSQSKNKEWSFPVRFLIRCPHSFRLIATVSTCCINVEISLRTNTETQFKDQ